LENTKPFLPINQIELRKRLIIDELVPELLVKEIDYKLKEGESEEIEIPRLKRLHKALFESILLEYGYTVYLISVLFDNDGFAIWGFDGDTEVLGCTNRHQIEFQFQVLLTRNFPKIPLDLIKSELQNN
jgi:hypothetical protein